MVLWYNVLNVTTLNAYTGVAIFCHGEPQSCRLQLQIREDQTHLNKLIKVEGLLES